MLVFINQNASCRKYEAPAMEMLQDTAEKGFADSGQQFDIDPYGKGIDF